MSRLARWSPPSAPRPKGRGWKSALEPSVRAVEAHLVPPSLDDVRSDARRLADAVGVPDLVMPLPVLQSLSGDLRRQGFRTSVFLRGREVAGIRPGRDGPPLGLAVDLGTTKLAGYLVDLAPGRRWPWRGQ